MNSICKDLIKKYPLYENFINQYFLKNKLEYFKDRPLDYCSIPDDCRSNSYLENYNGYIKYELGKYRIVNWINFIHFIKEESSHLIEKLLNNNSRIEKKSVFNHNSHTLVENPNSLKNKEIYINKENTIDDNIEILDNLDLEFIFLIKVIKFIHSLLI